MSSLNCMLVLVLCLLQSLHSIDAFHKRHPVKRLSLQKNRNKDGNRTLFQAGKDGYISRRGMYFQEETMNASTVEGMQYENVVLVCQVGGIPSPSVHWLKDGQRIDQSGSCLNTDSDDEDLNEGRPEKLSTYSTMSKLFIDCLDKTDEANYSCVAQTATHRITRSTYLTVARSHDPSMETLRACAGKGRPAKIYQQTNSVIELQGNTVRFFCRAQGNPTPSITWYDSRNETIQDGGNFRILSNGDLIIKDVDWLEHMGVFICEAKNAFGRDTSRPFLYPTFT